MGDRFGRRNRLVDDAVDVDAAVVPAPVPEAEAPPPPDPDPTPADHEAVDGPDEDVVDDDELDDVDDGRFARRNPIVDRALPGEGDTA